jgi:hypothetical protein
MFNERKDNVAKLLSMLAMFCSALALLSVLSCGSILLLTNLGSPDHSLNHILILIIISLNLLAVILGVISIRRNTIPLRSDTKAGLLLNVIFFVLFALIGIITIF